MCEGQSVQPQAHCLTFVAAEIVHDDDVARQERGQQELLNPGEEALSIDRTVDYSRRIDAIMAQGSNQRECAPFSMWHLRPQPLTAKTTTMGPRHVGLGPGLIDEDQARRIKPSLVLLPVGAAPRDLWSILLAREQAFFKRKYLTLVKLPQGTVARLDTPVGELGQQPPQREVGLRREPRMQPLPLRQLNRLAVAAELARRNSASAAITL